MLGGGEVFAPPGNYRTGAVALRSKHALRLQENAVHKRHERFRRISRDAGPLGREVESGRGA